MKSTVSQSEVRLPSTTLLMQAHAYSTCAVHSGHCLVEAIHKLLHCSGNLELPKLDRNKCGCTSSEDTCRLVCAWQIFAFLLFANNQLAKECLIHMSRKGMQCLRGLSPFRHVLCADDRKFRSPSTVATPREVG